MALSKILLSHPFSTASTVNDKYFDYWNLFTGRDNDFAPHLRTSYSKEGVDEADRHLHTVPSSRMSGTLRPLHQYAFT
jgi:hypothetical protein